MNQNRTHWPTFFCCSTSAIEVACLALQCCFSAHVSHCLQIKNLTEELALLTGRQDELREQNDEAHAKLAQMELLTQQVDALEDRVDALNNENEVNSDTCCGKQRATQCDGETQCMN